MTLDDFEIDGILGQGSNGTVYRATQFMLNGKERVVALKEVKLRERITAKQYREVVNEVTMMKKISHPNIIELYDSFIDRQIDTSSYHNLNRHES